MAKRGEWIAVETIRWRSFKGLGAAVVMCGVCGHQYGVPVQLLEQYREQSAPSGRLKRSGQSMASLGFAHGAKNAYANTAGAVSCDNCGSVSPHVRRA